MNKSQHNSIIEKIDRLFAIVYTLIIIVAIVIGICFFILLAFNIATAFICLLSGGVPIVLFSVLSIKLKSILTDMANYSLEAEEETRVSNPTNAFDSFERARFENMLVVKKVALLPEEYRRYLASQRSALEERLINATNDTERDALKNQIEIIEGLQN